MRFFLIVLLVDKHSISQINEVLSGDFEGGEIIMAIINAIRDDPPFTIVF